MSEIRGEQLIRKMRESRRSNPMLSICVAALALIVLFFATYPIWTTIFSSLPKAF